jgi:4-aminobutyrate aminotransferase
MIGIEIQDFHGKGEANPALRDWLIDMAFHLGLLLLPCGTSTIRICPPLCLTEEQVETGLLIISAAMSAAQLEASKG